MPEPATATLATLPTSIHEWDATPIPLPPTGASPGVTKAKIDELLRSADADKGKLRVVAEIIGSTVKAAASTALGEFVPGAGQLVTMVQHAAAANSTADHLEHITELNDNKCTCNEKQCLQVVDYIITKKSSKLVRRGARAAASVVPFANLGITLGEKLKGVFKMIRGTRKVNRRKFACILWINAKEGCPYAKGIVNELLGSPSKMMKALTNYAGILAIAEKMSSK